MRATVMTGPHEVEVAEVDDPTVQSPGAAIVEVSHTAICGSDLHMYHGSMLLPGVRPGHEFIGRIVAAGGGVENFAHGDEVLVSGVIGCGHCPPCLSGHLVRCENAGIQVFGTTDALHGGQAELVEVPLIDRHAHLVPDGLDPEAAVMLTDILPTGYLGAKRADVRPGDTVLVVGLGPVGMFALRSAQLLGASRVLAADTLPDRLARAEEFGAIPVDASSGTPAQVTELTGGRGADCAIEAVGSDQTILDAVMSVRAGGTVSVVGVNQNMAMPYPMMYALLRDITLRGTLASIPGTWPELVPLVVSGRLRPEEVVTHRMGLSEVAEAYRMFDDKDEGVLKVVLDPRN